MLALLSNPDSQRKRKHELDFDKVKVGESAHVGIDTITLPVLRALVSRARKKLGWNFKIYVHSTAYEIHRLEGQNPVVPKASAKRKVETVKQPEPETYYPGYKAPAQKTEDFDITKYKPLPTSKNYGLPPSIPTPPELTAADLAFARSLDDDDILEGETEEQYNARMDAKMGIAKLPAKFFND